MPARPRESTASRLVRAQAVIEVLGREVEYVVYPEEHHEMKNTGRPDRRIDRMERTLAWFDRFLGG